MIEEQRRILNMMAEGKLSAIEAEALFDALSQGKGAQLKAAGAQPRIAVPEPKYLRILVDGEDQGNPTKVNVRVPFDLIRAGMRLAALIPVVAYEPVNRALKDNGVDVDISKLKPEDLENLVAHLRELQIDVNGDGQHVRVFCE